MVSLKYLRAGQGINSPENIIFARIYFIKIYFYIQSERNYGFYHWTRLSVWALSFFLVQNFAKIKIKRKHSDSMFLFFLEKSLVFSPKKDYWELFLPHLNSDFSLVALSLVFLLFKLVLRTCHHLMLNPSWNASQWCNIRKLKK
jgi:hypothetical protein